MPLLRGCSAAWPVKTGHVKPLSTLPVSIIPLQVEESQLQAIAATATTSKTTATTQRSERVEERRSGAAATAGGAAADPSQEYGVHSGEEE